jgi:uncharacterized protein YcaQ
MDFRAFAFRSGAVAADAAGPASAADLVVLRVPIVKSVVVTPVQARRIAVRAQLLDGSATSVLDTIRRLGFLQIDPIATVAPPQELVLYSRLGKFDVAELDRLLWEERALFEWHGFIWPREDMPLVRARMRRRRTTANAWAREFLQANRRFRRYVLRELERNGPMLSRASAPTCCRPRNRTGGGARARCG